MYGNNFLPTITWADYNRPIVNEDSDDQAHSGTTSRKFTAKYRPGDQDPQGILSEPALIQEQSQNVIFGDEFEDGHIAGFWTLVSYNGSQIAEQDGSLKIIQDGSQQWEQQVWKQTPLPGQAVDFYVHLNYELVETDGCWFGYDVADVAYGEWIAAQFQWENGLFQLYCYSYSDADDWYDAPLIDINQDTVYVRFKYDPTADPKFQVYYALSEPSSDDEWLEVPGLGQIFNTVSDLEIYGYLGSADLGEENRGRTDFIRNWPPNTADYQLDFWCYPVDRNKVRVTTENAWNTRTYNFTGLIPNTWNRCTKLITCDEQLYTQFAFHSGAQESGTWYIDDIQLRKLTCEGSSSSSSSSCSSCSSSCSSWSSSSCSSSQSSSFSSLGVVCRDGLIMDEFNESDLNPCWTRYSWTTGPGGEIDNARMKPYDGRLTITDDRTVDYNYYIQQGIDYDPDTDTVSYVGVRLNYYDTYAKLTGPKNLVAAGWGANLQWHLGDCLDWGTVGAWIVWDNSTGSWQWSINAWPWYGESEDWEYFESDYIPLGTGEVTVWVRFKFYPDRSQGARMFYATTEPTTDSDWTEFVMTFSSGSTPPENWDWRPDPAWPYEMTFQVQSDNTTRGNASFKWKVDYVREWPPTGSLSSCSSSSSSSSSRSCDAYYGREYISDFYYQADCLPNGSMESDSDWGPHGSPKSQGRSTLQKHGGSASWRFVVDGINQGIKSDPFTVRVGGNRIDAYIYPVDRTTVTLDMTAGTQTHSKRLTGLTANTWNHVVDYFNARQTYSDAQLSFHSGSTESGTWFVDNVSVRLMVCPGGLRADEHNNEVIEPFWAEYEFNHPVEEKEGALVWDVASGNMSGSLAQFPQDDLDVWTRIDITPSNYGIFNSIGVYWGLENDYYTGDNPSAIVNFNWNWSRGVENRETIGYWVSAYGYWWSNENWDEWLYFTKGVYLGTNNDQPMPLYLRCKYSQSGDRLVYLYYSLTEPQTDSDWTELVWYDDTTTFDDYQSEWADGSPYTIEGKLNDWKYDLRDQNVYWETYGWVNTEQNAGNVKCYYHRHWESPYSHSSSSSCSSSFSSCSSCSSSLSSCSSSSSSFSSSCSSSSSSCSST